MQASVRRSGDQEILPPRPCQGTGPGGVLVARRGQGVAGLVQPLLSHHTGVQSVHCPVCGGINNVETAPLLHYTYSVSLQLEQISNV